jgi:hypothetical protein
MVPLPHLSMKLGKLLWTWSAESTSWQWPKYFFILTVISASLSENSRIIVKMLALQRTLVTISNTCFNIK